MWKHVFDILIPLSSMNSKQIKWNWSEEFQKAFDTIKQLVSSKILFFNPNFNKPFDIHTDARKLQLGAVVSQDDKPIAFYVRKLNSAQVDFNFERV